MQAFYPAKLFKRGLLLIYAAIALYAAIAMYNLPPIDWEYCRQYTTCEDDVCCAQATQERLDTMKKQN